MAFVPEDKIKGAAGPERPHDRGAAGWHGCQKAVVDAHPVSANLDRACCALRCRAKHPLHLHGMSAGLAGEVDGQRLAVEHHSADRAIQAVGKPIVRQRRIAAAQRNQRVDSAIAAGELGPQIDLAGR